MPDGIKEAFKPLQILPSKKVRAALVDGVYGGAFQASDEIMNEVFNAALQDVLGLLEFKMS